MLRLRSLLCEVRSAANSRLRACFAPCDVTSLAWRLLDGALPYPIEGLAKIALDPATKPELKVRCFAELAQYVYPKRKAVDLALNEWEENRSPKVVIEYIGRPDRTSQPASELPSGRPLADFERNG
jgi:hypothetical protein